MPLPVLGPLAIAGIEAAGSLIGTGLNNLFQKNAEKRQANYNQQMYQQQRNDALADWNRQNEYNSPKAQMERLAAAGLNPNMVYGSGSVTQSAQPIRSTDSKSLNTGAVQATMPSLAMGYLDAKAKQAQISNLQEQNKLIMQNQLKSASEQALNALKLKQGQFDLGMKEKLKDNVVQLSNISLDAAKVGIKKDEAQIMTMLSANERADVLKSNTLRETAEKILNYKQQRLESQARIATSSVQRSMLRKQIEHVDQQIKNLKNIEKNQLLDLNIRDKFGYNPNANPLNNLLPSLLTLIDKLSGKQTEDNFFEGYNFE